MSIQLKNSVTCKDVHAETSRLGESVELRYYGGRLYVYNVGTGNLVGLTGAELAVDALPSAFHVEKLGSGGSLTVTAINQELTFNDLDVEDFTEEAQLDFSDAILATLSFDAIINILSVTPGSLIINYEIVPDTDASAADLESALTTLNDPTVITSQLASSSTTNWGDASVTVSAGTTTTTADSKIIGASVVLPTGWHDDHVYDFNGTVYADMNNQWWRADAIKKWNVSGDALYIASNYNTTFYIVKLENGAHEVVKQLTSADINTTHPNYDQPQNWSGSKCWVVNNKIYAWTGYTRFGLIVFDNLTSGDNTHTVTHTNPTDWQGYGPFAVSTDAIWYTSTTKSLELKKKLLTDLNEEISVCTFDTAREIFKIDVDLDGNVYTLCVDDWSDTTGYFYKIAAGTSVPELIVPGGVATLHTPPHNYSQFSDSNSNQGGIDIWYDNNAIYYVDNSAGTYTHDPDYDYASGDIFHIRKVDIAAQEASTVLALSRSEYYQTMDGSTMSNAAMWYFKDQTFHAFSPWTGTVMTKKHISTLTSPYISAKSVGPLSLFKIQLDDGTPHQIASVTTSNVSKVFVPARPFYSLKINMWNSDNENINEWTIKVPEIAKLNSVTAGTAASQPVHLYTWKKPTADTWSHAGGAGVNGCYYGLSDTGWGHDASGNLYAITACTDTPILYRFKEDGGDNLEKLYTFSTAHYDTCYGMSDNPIGNGPGMLDRKFTYCNQMRFLNGSLYALILGRKSGSGGLGVIRFDDIESKSTASPPSDPTVLFTEQGRGGDFCVTENGIYYWVCSGGGGASSWKQLHKRNLDGTSSTIVANFNFSGQSSTNFIKAVETDGTNIYVLIAKVTPHWYSSGADSTKIYKFAESSPPGNNAANTLNCLWHTYSFNPGDLYGFGGDAGDVSAMHRMFKYYKGKLYFNNGYGHQSHHTFNLVTLNTADAIPSESILLEDVADIFGSRDNSGSELCQMCMVPTNDHLYFHSAISSADFLTGFVPAAHEAKNYAMSGRLMKMGAGIPSFIDAVVNHPNATLQYTTDVPATASSNWKDYSSSGFMAPSGSYTVTTRAKMDYTDDLGEDREHYSAGPYKSKAV